MSNCISPARYLGKDEYLLHKKKIIGNENIRTEELEALQRQTPNRRVLVFPIYVWFYYWGQNTSDKKRIERKKTRVAKKFDEKIKKGREEKEVARIKKQKKRRLSKLDQKIEKGSSFMQIIRPLAEPPEIFKESLAKETASQMELYMNSKGYFNSKASYNVDTLKRKRIKINYIIKENKPHKLSEIRYIIQDSALSALVEKNKSSSFLKRGENYDVDKLSRERERLEKLFKENGYYGFNRQYIEFEYDSTVANYTSDSTNKLLGKRRVDVDILIHNPSKGVHRVFKIDSVYFILENNNSILGLPRESKYYKGITYSYYKNNFSKKVLNYKVFLKQGDQYSLQNTVETQKQLLNLDNLKFVKIDFDTTGGRFLVKIVTSPANKYTTSEELGIGVSQGVAPGPTANVSFKIRNVFNSFENFESSVRYSFEGALSEGRDKIYRNQTLTATASLVFPHFVFPFNTRFKRSLNKYNPKMRLLSSYTLISRPGQYSRSNVRGSFIYNFQKGLHNYYSFSPIDLNIVNTINPTPQFQDTLQSWREKGVPLYYSYQDALVTNMNGSYNYNNFIPGVNKSAKYFNFYAESGGTVMRLLGERFIEDVIDFPIFSYFKFATDFRRYFPVSIKNTLATRISLGFAKPTSASNKALPYEKYFFAGGGTSIRGWNPRKLGPGSFTNYNSATRRSIFQENPGEILLELNLEYRFNILNITSVTRLDGAGFIDAGNVWTYYKQSITDEDTGEKTELRPGSVFEWNRFYRELAVGAGAGLRINFSFFIVRVDLAYRVFDPAEPLGKRFVLDDIGKARLEDGRNNPNFRPTLHFGINYPF